MLKQLDLTEGLTPEIRLQIYSLADELDQCVFVQTYRRVSTLIPAREFVPDSDRKKFITYACWPSSFYKNGKRPQH
jgi:hypothetical protein